MHTAGAALRYNTVRFQIVERCLAFIPGDFKGFACQDVHNWWVEFSEESYRSSREHIYYIVSLIRTAG